MVALRAVLWLGLVMALMPYETFDPAQGVIRVDEARVWHAVAALPHFCTRNADSCRAAGEMWQLGRAHADVALGRLDLWVARVSG